MAYSDETVCIYTKDGKKECFLIQNKPKVIISVDGVEILTKNETVIFPLDKFSKFTFENIVPVSIDSRQVPIYSIKNDVISTKGNTIVYDVYGREVEQSLDGLIDLSIAPKGIYIVKTNSVSFKYLKK